MVKQTNSDKFACESQNSREGRSYLTATILVLYGLFCHVTGGKLQIMYPQDARLEIRDRVIRVSLQRRVLENKHKLMSDNYKA